jgi:hypothetical protein
VSALRRRAGAARRRHPCQPICVRTHFAICVDDNDNAIVDACCKPWNALLALPARLATF